MFPPEAYPDLIVGLGAPDDAAVWRLDEQRALVVTTDFFTPVVDDPYEYGAIAAANALSDLYAMGAQPIFALNVAAMPPKLPSEIIQEILRGGAEKVREAGAAVAGGHSIQDDEPKFGLVAVGLCPLDHLFTKADAEPGQILVLSKPLGTGVTTTALKAGRAREEDVRQAVGWMMQLNAQIAQLGQAFNVRGATDITGYSLLGHGAELARASGVRLHLHLRSIPFLSGARRYAEEGHFPGGSADNKMYFENQVVFAEGIDEYNKMLLFDAQTSGGLLLALPADQLPAFSETAREKQVSAWVIGEVERGKGVLISDDHTASARIHESDAQPLWFVGIS